MTITLNSDYDVALSTALLGYVGETNARPVSVEGMEIDGADRYVLTIDYGDGTAYEVDITGGQWTPTADILRSAQTVSCQIAAKKLSGQEYILVKKSRIFRLRIGAAIGDNAVPSPSVAADALDRISAIGEQVETDVARAENAASTAMQAANNATKSATSAGLSADTAEQAAERAETAQASAKTFATQAETARQGAETARAEAVTAQNAAKISAAQASASAQQTEADKTITAGYAKTAKTNADSTAADRQAVTDMATQVTADKATVADHAAKVATDRKAAETAAQTAQAVADSLPEDYTTAVGKIAENTAEISAIKLTDKELKRRVDALFDMGNGVTHQFETDSETAYAKTVPTGGKLMSVKSIGGHSEVIDGEIVSAGVTEVVEESRNKIYEKWQGYSIDVSGTYVRNSNFDTHVAKIIKGRTYTVLGGAVYGLHIDKPTPNSKTYDGIRHATDMGYTFSAPIDGYVTMRAETGMQAAIWEGTVTPTAYAPYHRNTYPIPEAIKALPGYGWSAGTARNYADYENKKYVQCVGSVDLGTLDWELNTTSAVGNHFYGYVRPLNFKYLGVFGTTIYNVLCSKYRTVPRSSNVFVDKTITIDGVDVIVSQVQIKDTAYPDAAAFKQAMQGVILYYELETPFVTDISSLIPDDFLRNLTVEAGGSVTFKNSNGDSYRIPVPSEEEYIVKLSEVGGTT